MLRQKLIGGQQMKSPEEPATNDWIEKNTISVYHEKKLLSSKIINILLSNISFCWINSSETVDFTILQHNSVDNTIMVSTRRKKQQNKVLHSHLIQLLNFFINGSNIRVGATQKKQWKLKTMILLKYTGVQRLVQITEVVLKSPKNILPTELEKKW